ncbi:Heme-binding-like protein chloroplastic [Zea mays]|uniref:Heme-binding-like protein chloroplastic n=1 Tax=Zea mays TaxID=4577 RepID=A0A1D6KIG9_MAIZE|nr:Heme-binding-like protein chloroplastic [Zea mays]
MGTQALMLNTRWKVFRGDSSRQRDLMFSIVKPSMIQLRGNQMATSPLCSASPRLLRALGQPPRDVHSPRTVVVAAGTRVSRVEARASLVLALASHALSASQRRFAEHTDEASKYAFPSGRFEPRTLEEALMSVPDLETVLFRILKCEAEYEIREVEIWVHFNGSSQSFNVLASYLFDKNTASEQMEMTTPIFTRKGELNSQSMDMTTPVITKKVTSLS